MSLREGAIGVVAGGGAETVAAAVETLERGGNAADAALSGALTAFHAEPLLASAAGGGVMLAGDADRGFEVLDFSPIVPGLGLDQKPALDFAGVEIDFGEAQQTFHIGRGSAAVPTTFAGVCEAHRRWGSLPLSEVVAPAVRRCRDGVVVTALIASILRMLEPIWNRTADNAALYQVDGHRAAVGERLTNPAFADTLERLGADGEAPFYEGEIADATVAAFGPEAGGMLTARDLEQYRPTFREPLRLRLDQGELLVPPPPSMGGTMVALGVGLLARSGLQPEDFGTARHRRALVDAQLVTLAVRRERLGQPRRELAEALLTPEGLDEQARRLGTLAPLGLPPLDGRGATTHVSVLDGRGGAAAITVSNGEGCGHLMPGTGAAMNNFLGEEDINPGGFHLLRAGERMPTMMSPTIALRQGRPALVLGSGGANRLRSAITQVVCNRLLFERELLEAVLAPRIHVEPNRLSAELAGAPTAAFDELSARFPAADLFPGRSLFFGGVHAVARDHEGRLSGAGDPRRGGASAPD